MPVMPAPTTSTSTPAASRRERSSDAGSDGAMRPLRLTPAGRAAYCTDRSSMRVVATVDQHRTALPVPYAMDPALPDRVPKERYYDPDFYQLEIELLWPRVWQMACRLEEIPQPHDFVEYEFLDQSIVVLRTEDMGVRAFQNACRHRGVRF